MHMQSAAIFAGQAAMSPVTAMSLRGTALPLSLRITLGFNMSPPGHLIESKKRPPEGGLRFTQAYLNLFLEAFAQHLHIAELVVFGVPHEHE
jgi:hypothetical protein